MENKIDKRWLDNEYIKKHKKALKELQRIQLQNIKSLNKHRIFKIKDKIK